MAQRVHGQPGTTRGPASWSTATRSSREGKHGQYPSGNSLAVTPSRVRSASGAWHAWNNNAARSRACMRSMPQTPTKSRNGRARRTRRTQAPAVAHCPRARSMALLAPGAAASDASDSSASTDCVAPRSVIRRSLERSADRVRSTSIPTARRFGARRVSVLLRAHAFAGQNRERSTHLG